MARCHRRLAAPAGPALSKERRSQRSSRTPAELSIFATFPALQHTAVGSRSLSILRRTARGDGFERYYLERFQIGIELRSSRFRLPRRSHHEKRERQFPANDPEEHTEHPHATTGHPVDEIATPLVCQAILSEDWHTKPEWSQNTPASRFDSVTNSHQFRPLTSVLPRPSGSFRQRSKRPLRGHLHPYAASSAIGRRAPKIGIGGRLAAPPLPHHRAYGSVPRRFDRVKRGQERRGGED